jgi:hypothetical protein
MLTPEQQRKIRQLESIGYLTGSVEASSAQGVTVYDGRSAGNGLNLVVSAHAPEAVLMTMSGRIVHRWRCTFSRAWPDLHVESWDPDRRRPLTFFRRAHLMPNGDLLAIFDGFGLVKVDKDSRLLWARRNGSHHDLYVARNGHIFVLTRKAHLNPAYNAREPILEDYVCELDSQGNLLDRLSVLDALRDSPFAPVLTRLTPSGGDILHSNTIELLEPGSGRTIPPGWTGKVLISIRYLSLVCIVDMVNRTVVWAESDYWARQHQPTLLPSGHLLVLNNEAGPKQSSVLEFDPVGRRVLWQYRGSPEQPFYTFSCGSCQRLSNGNTLITESDPGRAFEITPNGRIVWEYINPHRAGQHHELVATLFEVVRFEGQTSFDWLRPDTGR